MLSSAKPYLMIALLLALPGAASAQGAPADRCTGTLCDLYYGGPPAPPQPGAKPAAPTPLTVPQGGILGFFSGGKTQATSQGTAAAPATHPMVAIGGGGLAAMARGEAPTRCTGTLCDLYYGGPPPATPEPAAPAAEAAPALPQAAAMPTADEAAPPPGVRYQPEPEEVKPRCASTARDPWKCYRR